VEVHITFFKLNQLITFYRAPQRYAQYAFAHYNLEFTYKFSRYYYAKYI